MAFLYTATQSMQTAPFVGITSTNGAVCVFCMLLLKKSAAGMRVDYGVDRFINDGFDSISETGVEIQSFNVPSKFMLILEFVVSAISEPAFSLSVFLRLLEPFVVFVLMLYSS